MTPVCKLLIRADAGPKIGTGHVMRCIALGQSLRLMGGSVTFACGTLPGKLKERIENEDFQFKEMDNSDLASDAQQLNQLVADIRPDWLLLDGYRFDDGYESLLQLNGTRLGCIDDYGHARHQEADLVVNQNIFSSKMDYRHLDAGNLLTGPQYAMLRKEFQSVDQDSRPKVPLRARRIMITFGGSDPENMTARIIGSIDDATIERSSIDVIVGPGYQHMDSLRPLIKSGRSTIRIHQNVDNMQSLMSRTHLAITAGGSTCYELARCGVPFVVIPIADNQIPIAEKISELGIAELVTPDQLQGTQLQKAISKIIRDVDRRRDMAEISQKLIDGQGANRVSRRVISQAFNFRDATLDDSMLLLDWRNEPEIRAVSFENKTIPIETHQHWLSNKLKSQQSRLQIIESPSGTPVAQIRLDFSPAMDSAVFSINLIQGYRGRGLGTALIERAIRETTNSHPGILLIAQIKANNAASQQAFLKAGFRPSTSKTINNQVALEYVYQHQTPASVFRKAS